MDTCAGQSEDPAMRTHEKNFRAASVLVFLGLVVFCFSLIAASEMLVEGSPALSRLLQTLHLVASRPW